MSQPATEELADARERLSEAALALDAAHRDYEAALSVYRAIRDRTAYVAE